MGGVSSLTGCQTRKPSFFEPLNVAAEQAAEKDVLRCHSERSEESLFDRSIEKKPIEILRFAQNDSGLSFSASCKPRTDGACGAAEAVRTETVVILWRDGA
jgi:hypothetical protein